jgi:type IV secretion system protein VirD4
LQGNAGVKLYLTPSDEKTIEELSKAVGKTTKTVITRSRSTGKNPFEGRSQSTRTEEASLLPEDEARRLPLDEIIMVVDAQMPVRAKRIQYFDDRLFSAIHAAQAGELPFPVMGGAGDKGRFGSGAGASEPTKPQPGANTAIARQDETISEKEADGLAKSPKKAATSVLAVVAEDQRQMELDFAEQAAMPVREPNDVETEELVGAVDDLGDLENSLAKGETH